MKKYLYTKKGQNLYRNTNLFIPQYVYGRTAVQKHSYCGTNVDELQREW